jgi:2'-5' RNA ligase
MAHSSALLVLFFLSSWPPHINLLYPFLQLKYTPSSSRSNNDNNNGDEGLVDDDSSLYSVYDIVRRIELVTRQFLPFKIVLDEFGTFGGKRRGVLWLNPSSFKTFGRTFNESEQIGSVSTTAESSTVPPLHELQRRLEEAFPMCRDQSQKGDEGSFVPHMTISHFECLHDAQSAQRSLLEHHDNHGPMSFLLDRIYLLERKGDSGQFLRVAQIALGSNDNDDNYDANQTNRVIVQTQIFDPPSAFPTMPKIELDWVLEERMKLKKRRNGRGKAGWRRNSRPREERTECIHDTPEIIAAKRAERKAKRECVLLMRSDEEGDEVVRHDMDNS